MKPMSPIFFSVLYQWLRRNPPYPESKTNLIGIGHFIRHNNNLLINEWAISIKLGQEIIRMKEDPLYLNLVHAQFYLV